MPIQISISHLYWLPCFDSAKYQTTFFSIKPVSSITPVFPQNDYQGKIKKTNKHSKCGPVFEISILQEL